MENNSKYIFMLIGKTGSGKSATGNSILGEKCFVSSDKAVSVTKEISVQAVTRYGFTVTVIDAPGVMDTSVNSDDAKSKSCSEMTAAMNQCPTDGKLAIVLVLKYGDRFTEENRLTMYILKNIFGEKDLWRSCIIVLTHGDLFKINNEDDVTFESWLRDQGGELGELLKDCSYRCVIFNNRTKRPEESDEQFLELVKLTEELDQDYTMAKFEEAKKRQNRLMLEAKLPEINKDYNEKMKTFITTSRSLFSKGRTYDAFVGSIEKLCVDLMKLASPDTIYYNEGEPLLFQEQRSELMILKEDIETKVTLNDLEIRALRIKERTNPYDPFWQQSVSGLEMSIDQIARRKIKPTAYQGVIDSLKDQLEDFKLIIERHYFIDLYQRRINNLTSELNALPIPSELDTISNYSAEVSKILHEVTELDVKLKKMDRLFSMIHKLQQLIRYKLEDSSVTSGWNRTAWMMGAVSLKAVFIPGVGIPLSLGLNALPIIGKTVHRQYLKYKNDQ